MLMESNHEKFINLVPLFLDSDLGLLQHLRWSSL